MRRTYISPEYQNNLAPGTLNMTEQSNFFSSKMIDIEEEIKIDNIDIIWYQNDKNEQMDFSLESIFSPNFYSTSNDKKDNHILEIDKKQSNYQKERNTRWILDIDIRSILINYLFATLKKYRTFEGVKNKSTIYNDVNVSIKEYIYINLINRYKIKKIDFYLAYRNLTEEGYLRYKNNWNINLPDNSLYNNYQIITESDESKIRLIFEQLISSQYNFDYYFNISFERI
jgi:hypothetical protein